MRCSGPHYIGAVVSAAAAAVVISVVGVRYCSCAVVSTTVLQLLALSPHGKKVPGRISPVARDFFGIVVCLRRAIVHMYMHNVHMYMMTCSGCTSIAGIGSSLPRNLQKR